jgi:hypothetical protein
MQQTDQASAKDMVNLFVETMTVLKEIPESEVSMK